MPEEIPSSWNYRMIESQEPPSVGAKNSGSCKEQQDPFTVSPAPRTGINKNQSTRLPYLFFTCPVICEWLLVRGPYCLTARKCFQILLPRLPSLHLFMGLFCPSGRELRGGEGGRGAVGLQSKPLDPTYCCGKIF